MENSNDFFAINKHFWQFGGILGRLDYFVNQLVAGGLSLIACLPLVLLTTGNSLLGLLGGLVSGVTLLAIGVFAFGNSFKRLRDMRGTTEGELGWRIGLVVAMLFPYINLVTYCFLWFYPGAITSKTSGNHHIVQGTDNDSLAAIKSLHELKTAGALTEVEFQEKKNELLKKAA